MCKTRKIISILISFMFVFNFSIGQNFLETPDISIDTSISSTNSETIFSMHQTTQVPVTTAGVYNTGAFVTTWNVVSNGTTITIPLYDGVGYDFDIDRGDNIVEYYNSASLGSISHMYATGGIKIIQITGIFPRIYFNNNAVDKDKILTIEQRGDIEWSSMEKSFQGCTNLSVPATDVPSLINLTNTSFMFAGTNANPDTTDWNTSNITNMSAMFRSNSTANPNTTNWNTSNVTNMASMFSQNTTANPDTSNWNTSSVLNMSNMFNGATNANPDTSNWNTSSVINMLNMFNGATNANPDTTNWNMSSVSSISYMFNGATSANPDTSNWNTSNIKQMSSVFFGATSANPDTSNWNTSSVMNMLNMFNGATSANPDMSNWDISNVINLSSLVSNTNLSMENYDNALNAWNKQTLKSNLNLGTVNTTYCFSKDAKTNIENTYNWTISDQGDGCDTYRYFTDPVELGPVTSDTITATITGSVLALKKRDYSNTNSCDTTGSSYSYDITTPIPVQDTAENNGKFICLYAENASGYVTTLLSTNPININDIVIPTCTVEYNPSTDTNTDVISTLTGCNEPITITNNGGLSGYTFTDNGIFTYEYEDLAGNTGSTIATVTWIDKIAPTCTVEYNPGTDTNTDVISTLTGCNEPIIITNNGGLSGYTFTANGTFTYEYEDLVGNTGSTTATVTWIKSTTNTSSGGGGGYTKTPDNCPDGDYSDSRYDRDCGEIEDTEITDNSGENGIDNITDIDESDLVEITEEILNICNYAKELGVEKDCLEILKKDNYLDRIELAELAVLFSVKELDKGLVNQQGTCSNYEDISDLNKKETIFAMTSCNMRIMGLESDGKTPQASFRPYDLVTRAEFGTVLSRLLRNDTYNPQEGQEWYEGHLNVLNEEGIMQYIDNPEQTELYSYALLMLYRVGK